MFQSTEKNKVNKDLMISCLIAGFASLYLSLGITSYSNRNSLSVLKVLGDMNGSIILECINPGKLFSGMTGGSLLGSLYFAAIVCACLMVYYLIDKKNQIL